MKSEKKRCIKCNLPEDYPKLSIDEAGVCSLCRAAEDREDKRFYLGIDALRSDIGAILERYPGERKYDCIVGCSGGRDSTYLVYWLKKVLGLNVLALTMTHKFMPEQTLDNVKNVTKNLGVDVVFVENEALNRYGTECVRAWAKNPIPETLVSFCTGCRHGLKRAIPEYARKNNIPILFMGNTPMEKLTYRTDLLSPNPDKPSRKGMLIGYTKTLLQNPAFFRSPKNLYVQFKDFSSKKKKKRTQAQWPVTIEPFFHYVEWQEEEVVGTIQRFGWSYDESLNSTWRSDCFVNLVRQYYYKRLLGYNDLDAYYAKEIRSGKVTKEAALERIAREGDYAPELIARILREQYGLDYDAIEKRIREKT